MRSEHLAWIAALALAGVAHGQKAVVVARGLYESPGLFVPVALAELPDANGNVLRLSITGWTAEAVGSHPLSPSEALVGELSVTPLFAHGGNRLFLAGTEHKELEFHDTSLTAAIGLHFDHGEHLSSQLRALFLREWVRGLGSTETDFWRRPYVGLELSGTLEWLRSDDPYRTRADGLRITLHGQALGGAQAWARGDLSVSLGRKLGPAFVGLTGFAFASTTSNLVARTLVGGSWDALEGVELVGHPEGALRMQNGAVVNGRADFQLGRLLELGLRGSAGCADGACHDGEGVQLGLPVEGAELTVGAAIADHQSSQWVVFSGVMVATIL